MEEVKVVKYELASGRIPYDDWVERLDKTVRNAVRARIARLRSGNYGDSKRVVGADGIFELRIHMGPGYRIYFAKEGAVLVILLCAGDKGRQQRDIERAKEYLKDYRAND